MTRELSIFHIILLAMTYIGILIHVIVLPPLFNVAGRDAWVSIFFSLFIYIIWSLLILYILKVTKRENLYQWLKNNFGLIAAIGVYSFIFIYLFLMAAITVKDMIIWINSSFLPQTPSTVLFICFLILCIAMANTNIKTITIVNGILLPFVIILGIFISIVNFHNKDFSLLFPIFEHGFSPMIRGSIYVGIGMAEIMAITFLQHHIKSNVKYIHLLIIGLLTAWLSLGPVTGGLATFGATKSSQLLFPAYEQWAIGTISRYIEHFDFFSIYQWLSGAFIRVSLFLFLIVDLLQIPKGRKRLFMLFALSFAMLIFHVFIRDYNKYYVLSGHYLLPLLFIIMLSISFIVTIFAFIYQRRNQQNDKKSAN